RHNRRVAKEQISHCEEAPDEKDAPTPQFLIPVAPFLERDLVLFCFEHVHDRFPVEMRFASVSAAFFPLDCGASRFPGHLAIRLEPPFTFSPTFTRISAPFGSQTSTREPNRTSPMRSPHTTCSPCFFQETTRRAMSPAICLKTISPDSVLSVNTFCSFSRDARARMAAKNFPGRYSILVIVPLAGARFTFTFQIARKMLTRWPGRPPFSSSVTTTTRPSAGDTTAAGSAGMRRSGSRKKENTNRARNTKTAAIKYQSRRKPAPPNTSSRNPK